MADPLDKIRSLIRSPSDAIRWACVLEATAPKAGNVYPGQPFADLSHHDFVLAAEIASTTLTANGQAIGQRVLQCVEQTVSSTGSNVNLGIVLLLAPIVAADQAGSPAGEAAVREGWQSAISEQLVALDSHDGQAIFRAIAGASAGGLGEVDQLDVNNVPSDSDVDLLAAMELAQSHDRIARQYATKFTDLIDRVTPMVVRAIAESGDLLGGIALAHLRLLADEPDSLISRKNGAAVAIDVQKRARAVDPNDPTSVAEFDQSLREQGNRLNPGTTADLLAAALYLILRSPSSTFREAQ